MGEEDGVERMNGIVPIVRQFILLAGLLCLLASLALSDGWLVWGGFDGGLWILTTKMHSILFFSLSS